MRKNNEVVTNTFSSINASTTIKGEIFSESDLRIDGKVEGNIESKAKIVLGESAAITGNVKSSNADISCSVEGDIYVHELLKLNASAVVRGDIYVRKLIVENGAVFIGKCEMGGNLSPKPESKPKTEEEKKTDNPAPSNDSLFNKGR